MSFVDLDTHPQKHNLMSKAFTIDTGIGEGEYLKELNPKYQTALKGAREELSAARK